MLYQPPLSPIYNRLSDGQLDARIREAKARLGSSLAILGHHYQMDEVIDYADHCGDSFKLSQIAANLPDARYIVFCGVHFMAESADILTGGTRSVILPDLSAGCSMADMAEIGQLEAAWEELSDTLPPGTRLVPVTYVNSSAAVKAFVGTHGGACCTSSNATSVVRWALSGGQWASEDDRPEGPVKLLFLPDQHLGRNTLLAMGYALDAMLVWDPQAELGGHTPEALRTATAFLWKGHCSVHQLFKPEQVDQIRQADPGIQVIVHPECRYEVCQKADFVGSTEFIIRTVQDAPAGTRWAVGTEIHLVNRLARQQADAGKVVQSLSGIQCLCTTMYRIDRKHLCWVLDELIAGRVVNQIRVPPAIREQSLLALERMLAHAGSGRIAMAVD